MNPIPFTLTKDQIIAQAINSNINQDELSLEQFKQSFQRSFEFIWNNPNVGTPQEILTAYGTQAAQLFIDAQNIVKAIMTIDPSYLPPTPPMAFTIEADGNVTVTLNS